MLQVEALAQLGGIMMMDAEQAKENPEFFFAGIESCKWRRPVVPGDTLVSHCRLHASGPCKLRLGHDTM